MQAIIYSKELPITKAMKVKLDRELMDDLPEKAWFHQAGNFTVCLLEINGLTFVGATKRNCARDPEDKPEFAREAAFGRAVEDALDYLVRFPKG